jgi:CRISPR-associated protein Cas1
MVSEAALRDAWERVRTGGRAPGLDGVSLASFDRHLDREIAVLRSEILTGRYRPWPARRVGIPKPSGGVRHIGVQAVRDRVAQRALMAVLQPRVEPLLEPASFAYRPGRSIHQALGRVAELHASGCEWVARSDVELCFDSLDREALDRALGPVLPEADARRLVRAWLGAGYVDGAGWAEPGLGVPQGDVLSPLLCNLYLDPVDEAVSGQGCGLVRYADDLAIVGRTEAVVRGGLRRAEAALARLALRLNPAKTHVGTFTQGFEFLGAAVVGSLILPLHRAGQSGPFGRYSLGYGRGDHLYRPTAPAHRPAGGLPLVQSDLGLRRRMLEMMAAERRGGEMPALADALIDAWRTGGLLGDPAAPRRREAWDSVYLI